MIKRNKEEIIKILKYVFASGTSFVIDLALFTLFNFLLKNHFSTSINIFIATIIARILSSLYNYFLNSKLVFKSNKKGTLISYYILVVIQMIVSATLVSITKKYVRRNVTIIKFVIDIVIFIVNYIVQRNIIFKEKKEKKTMKKYIPTIIFLLILFVFLISSTYSYKINDKSYTKQILLSEVTSIIDNNKYEFTTERDNLSKILIQFNYKDDVPQDTKIFIELADENDNVIKSSSVRLKKLNYKKEYEFNLEDKNVLKSKVLKLKIDTSKEELNNDINISKINNYYFEKNNRIFFTIITAVITLIVVVVAIIFDKKDIKIEKLYLILAILIYGLYVLFFPLFTTHDELYHWFRAYEISEGNMLSDINEKKAQTMLPTGISEIHTKEYYEINYRTLKNTIGIHNNKNNRAYHDMSAVALYSPVQYMPQSIGIFIARLFTDRPLVMAYMGRVMNAIFSIILIYFSIKIIPFGKRVLFTIAFLPIAVEGFTSLSADAITISIAMFLISYILNIIYDKNKKSITKKDYAIILISSIIIALCKIVYIPIVLLPLLIPQKKFKSKKQFLIFTISIAIISILCNLTWLKIASKYLNLYNEGKVAVSASRLSPSTQIIDALTHPFNFLSMLIYTALSNSKSYIMSMLGENLGWGEVIYPLSITPIAFLIMLIINSLFDNKGNKKLDKKSNILFIIISLCVIGLIFASLYVQFTPPESKTILGVQGRYFIPILPLILLLITNFKNTYSPKINLNKITFSTCLLLNYSIVLTLIIHFL